MNEKGKLCPRLDRPCIRQECEWFDDRDLKRCLFWLLVKQLILLHDTIMPAALEEEGQRHRGDYWWNG